MKETRTINLNGIVFHIDNDAYRSLNDYLQDIELRLPQDEREDVMADIEARICELLQSALFAKNVQVVEIKMIEDIKARIGKPEDFGENKRPQIKASKQSERSGCSRVFKITMYVILIIIALQILFPILVTVFALCMAGLGLGVGAFSTLPFFGDVFFGNNIGAAVFASVAAIVAIGLPIYALIKTIISYMRTRRGPSGRWWLIAILCWILSIVCFSTAIFKQAKQVTNWNALPHMIHHIDVYDSNDSTAVRIDFCGDDDEDEGYLEIEE